MSFGRKRFYWLLILPLFWAAFAFLKTTPIWATRPRQIIVFRPEIADSLQEAILSKEKVITEKKLRLINARTAWLTKVQADRLQRDPRVLRIDPDVEVFALPRRFRRDWCDRYPWLPWCPKPTPTVTPTPSPEPTPTPIPTATPTPLPSETPTPTPTPPSESQPVPWGVARIAADEAWAIASGSAVRVAVLDTGIDIDHPDLDDNLESCVNFIRWWRDCNDDNGHGTHVAGIIAAEDNDFGVVGVAPQAYLDGLKVLDRRGRGYLSDVIEALDWAVAHQVQVVNMSLGTTSDVPSFKEAVAKVNQAGIVQVAAAGNDGPDLGTVVYPAKYPEVIAVAASDAADQIPSWSSRGPEVDLTAPGVSIYSTYRHGGYKELSGTSMSAPHVAGVVALRLEDHHGETPAMIKTILQTTADPLPFDATWVGAGLVNAYQAVLAP